MNKLGDLGVDAGTELKLIIMGKDIIYWTIKITLYVKHN